VLVELIFAMILSLELVPADIGTYTVDVLENAAATMEVSAERDGAVARFRDANGELILTVERSETTAHVYTAFPAEGPPAVLDTGIALEAVQPFATAPTQSLSAPPGTEEAGAIEWTLARRGGLFYLGIPSAQTLLVIRTGGAS
jgi:hypothetical protein